VSPIDHGPDTGCLHGSTREPAPLDRSRTSVRETIGYRARIKVTHETSRTMRTVSTALMRHVVVAKRFR
jgi:hypothetical protein